MDNFWKCFWYFAITGIASFLIGRILPKKWFRADCFPYYSFAFEKEGRIYDKLNIRRWQNKVPDMSKIFPKLMPAKSLSSNYQECIPRMLQETCVAEFIHLILCVTGLYCIKLWPGVGGIVFAVVYIVVFNLPFILIQRYNRPRLMKLAKSMGKISGKE